MNILKVDRERSRILLNDEAIGKNIVIHVKSVTRFPGQDKLKVECTYQGKACSLWVSPTAKQSFLTAMEGDPEQLYVSVERVSTNEHVWHRFVFSKTMQLTKAQVAALIGHRYDVEEPKMYRGDNIERLEAMGLITITDKYRPNLRRTIEGGYMCGTVRLTPRGHEVTNDLLAAIMARGYEVV